MNINDLTIGEAKELTKLFDKGEAAHPYVVGKNYFIRTVTHYYTGKLVQVTNQELVLEDAAWIADTGRYQQALVTGSLSEVEIYPAGQVIVGRGAVVDASVWAHTLPKEQK